MEFTLVLTIVLGLCVGAVVADVLFGPEQPATSSSGSHGDRWDPWATWLRKARLAASGLGLWLRRSFERGWAALARSFPAQRHGSDRPPNDILPPPVAPPLHAPVAPPLHAPAASPQVAAFVDQPVEPNGDKVLVGVGAGGNGPGPSSGSGAAPAPVLLRPAGPSTYPRSTSPTSAPPMAAAFPASVRLKAGLGLLVYIGLAGAVLAAILLALAGIIARAVGGI